MKINTIFFGSGENSVIVFKKIITLPYLNIKSVVTKPPQKSGRGQNLSATTIAKLADSNSLLCLETEKITADLIKKIAHLKPHLGILASFGAIIPSSLLEIFPKGIINIHPSLLPKYRGASPVAAALLSGQEKTGVSLMLLDEKLDHGPILAQKEIAIPPNVNHQQLSKTLFKSGAQLLATALPQYLKEKLSPTPQNHSQATFAKRLKRADGFVPFDQLKPAINTGQDAKKINQKVAAYNPWPGVYSFFPNIKKGQNQPVRVKILATRCQQDKLHLRQVHFAGKNPILWNKNLQKIYFDEQD